MTRYFGEALIVISAVVFAESSERIRARPCHPKQFQFCVFWGRRAGSRARVEIVFHVTTAAAPGAVENC